MDGNSGLIIAFIILFVRDGLSQRHGSFGYQPNSSGTSLQGFGSLFGNGQQNSQLESTGNNREGENQGASDSSSFNLGSTFGSLKVENSRKISSSGNNNNNHQWNSGSGWNSGSQTGGFEFDSGYQASSSGFGNNQNRPNGNSGSNYNRGSGSSSSSSSSGWNFGNEKQERNPAAQSDKGHSSASKEENQRKTNTNSGSKRPGSSSGSTGSEFSFNFENENSKKTVGSEFGGSSDSSFGFGLRPQGSSNSTDIGNSNWSSGNQNGDRKTESFGFSTFNKEKNHERPSGWNSGFGGTTRRPQGSSSFSGSGSSKPQGSSGNSGSYSNHGSSSNSNSRRPEGASSGSSSLGLSSSFDSKRPQPAGSSSSSSSSSSSNQGSSFSFNSKNPQGSSGNGFNSGVNFNHDSNSKRPQGSSSSGSESGFSSTKKPEDNQKTNTDLRPSSSSRDPPKKQSGSATSATSQPDKSTGNGKGNENANEKKTEQIDWDALEKENQRGGINFDLTELWRPEDRKDPAWRSIWTRTRFPREVDGLDKTGKLSPVCHCVDYPACPPENRVDFIKFFQNYYRDLRVRMLECASVKKICCITSRSGQEESGTHPACGRRVSKLAEHDISNDGSANYGDYPWMLRLVSVGGTGEETLCSATLVHNSIALTTASCALLLTGKEVRVRSGEWNVVGGNNKNKVEETTIGKVYLHPDFDVVSYSKDLALLFLNTPFHYDRGANTICLPTHHDSWDGNKCVVVGWTRRNGSGLTPAVLKQVGLQIVAQGKCHHLDGLKNGLSDLEDPGFFCAHARKGDPYLGDVGASLLCPLYNTDTLIQVGFVSNAAREKGNHNAATFTDTLDSLDWVYRMESLYAFVTGEDPTE